MAYLKFNKTELVNLEYSLKREVLATNNVGGYLNTTIVGCNTRKYHGLFAVPIYRYGGHRYMLLSSIDETLFQHEKPFNLGIHCYGDVYEPRGHKYIVDLHMDPIPTVTYSVGGMLFKKEMVFSRKSEQLLIRYTLVEANAQTTLRLKPFLSFRSIHELTHANTDADTHYRNVDNGVSFKLYEGFPDLNLQFSKPYDYVHCPDWYRDITYIEEARRGFDCSEDLLVPGFFEFPIKKGESIVISVSTSEVKADTIKSQFTKQKNSITPCNDYDACLKTAASELISLNENGSSCICTGFSWHEIGGLRETLISLPGLTLYNDGNVKLFEQILNDLIKENKDYLFSGCNQAEAPLRIVDVLQKFADFKQDPGAVWKKYGKTVRAIVESYLNGRPEVKVSDNGLLFAEKFNTPLSWMNAYVDGHPSTERRGWQVETNCLWYNALCYVIENEGKTALATRCKKVRENFEKNFLDIFWVEERHHLADYVDEKGQNVFTRPNQLYACALKYSPVPEEVQAEILRAVTRELVTTRGIRTLSPKNPLYRSRYEGNQHDRDTATHNGCNRPWLLGPYAEASFKLFGSQFLRSAKELVSGFEEDMNIHGIGNVAEIYDGDPPYMPHGAISSAMSVAEIIKVKYLINKCEEEDK